MQQFGVIGLSVMGKNLALNVRNHGFSVSGFSIDKPEVDAFAKYEDDKLKPCYTWEEFVNSLEKPRKILIQIMAGDPVDQTLQKLLPLLDKGDILIDGGNSNYHDTNRRFHEMEKHGIHFIGMGVSGGEEGALNGPALMPGGDEPAYKEVAQFLKLLPLRILKASHVSTTWDLKVLVTMSKWCTMVSNTVLCRNFQKFTTYSVTLLTRAMMKCQKFLINGIMVR